MRVVPRKRKAAPLTFAEVSVTVPQAAIALGYHVDTIRRFVASGRLRAAPRSKPRAHIRIPRSELSRFLDTLRRYPPNIGKL